jgi:hypothetical protein
VPNILLCRGCPTLWIRSQHIEKTEVLNQPAPREENQPPHITIGATAEAFHQFTYLWCTIIPDDKFDKEVDNRLAKANSAFDRFYKRIWSNKHLKKSTKISVYRAVVLTTILYGFKSWVKYRHHLRLLDRFHQRFFFAILSIIRVTTSPMLKFSNKKRSYVSRPCC